jgi:hypothetical protein
MAGAESAHKSAGAEADKRQPRLAEEAVVVRAAGAESNLEGAEVEAVCHRQHCRHNH